jgi:hypothetical protein
MVEVLRFQARCCLLFLFPQHRQQGKPSSEVTCWDTLVEDIRRSYRQCLKHDELDRWVQGLAGQVLGVVQHNLASGAAEPGWPVHTILLGTLYLAGRAVWP